MSENTTENITKNIATHGLSVLNVGNPGNKGGTGRPKSEVRARCVGAFDARISVAEEILDDPDSTPADRLRALDLLGKYGGLQQVDQTSGDEPIKVTVTYDEPTK